jgi:hypothetical protein
MTQLFQQIESLIPKLHGWATVKKCQMLAASVIALQPETSIIIGVWGGRDTFALGLAHKFIGKGRVMAIDPWASVASAQGQTTNADKQWWANIDHELVYNDFLKNRTELGLNDTVLVYRMISDYADVPKRIDGVLVVDGNHGPNAITDVDRFVPSVATGAVVLLDDKNWSGGYVAKAIEKIKTMGFRSLYEVDTSEMFQRISG